MFEIEKTFHFEAGHRLMHHDGQCRDPHGHSYLLKIIIRSESLIKTGPKQNMVMDFSEISSLVKPMIDKYFEHKWLNDTLNTESPTAEFMAEWIFNYLDPKIQQLAAVTIYETATSRVTFSKFKIDN